MSCDGLVTCPWCILPLSQWLLDLDNSDSLDPERKMWVKIRNVGIFWHKPKLLKIRMYLFGKINFVVAHRLQIWVNYNKIKLILGQQKIVFKLMTSWPKGSRRVDHNRWSLIQKPKHLNLWCSGSALRNCITFILFWSKSCQGACSIL